MARQGYDDTDNIGKVEALLLDEPGLTRQAAIKRVVGTNRSNVRRIEQKMSRIAAEAPVPQPIAAEKLPPADLKPWSEAQYAAVAAVAFVLTLCAWMFWPDASLRMVMGVYWLKLKLTVLAFGPLDASGHVALAAIERRFSASGDLATDLRLLGTVSHDVTLASRAVIAAAITATMVWSVRTLACMPTERGATREGKPRKALLDIHLGEALRTPRHALVCVVLAGGLGCTMPVLGDMALVAVLGITVHCIGGFGWPFVSGTERKPG